MPTNLPAEYAKVETEYKAATDPDEKITLLEELISTVPKHKGTDHLRADLRRKLSKLKEVAQTQKKSGRTASPYHIDREGAGQILLVGPTNTGKSALVNALTNASPEVSAAPYSTWGPTPGMMMVDNVQIQLIDTPPLNPDYVDPEMFNLIRRCDIILVVVDLQTDPDVQLEETIALLEQNRILAPHRQHSYEGARRPSVIPIYVVANKCDDSECDEVFEILGELVEDEWLFVPVSATGSRNLERLKWLIYGELGIMRVYSKPPGKDPDRTTPFVMGIGGTVADFARKVHRDFYDQLKSARVWGRGVFDGQMVGRDHVLHDEDVVELKI